jgi:HPt (histidine-containing phosphotransfer) domain-containing protein
MDDYLTKPIDPEQLSAVLCRQLGAAARPLTLAPARSQLRTRSQPPPEALPPLALLQSGLRRPPQAVEAFSRRTPQDLAELHAVARQARRDEVRRIAHKLKGSAGSLGALQLARLCEGLEDAADNASGEALGELVITLEQAFQRTLAALQQEQPGPSAAREGSP